MALVIALAVNNGFKNTLQRNLLGAMAHINVMEKEPLYGIENWRDMAARLRKLPHVTDVSPAIYTPALLMGGLQPKYVVLKGVDVDTEIGHDRFAAASQDGIARPAARPERQPAGHRSGIGHCRRYRNAPAFPDRRGIPGCGAYPHGPQDVRGVPFA